MTQSSLRTTRSSTCGPISGGQTIGAACGSGMAPEYQNKPSLSLSNAAVGTRAQAYRYGGMNGHDTDETAARDLGNESEPARSGAVTYFVDDFECRGYLAAPDTEGPAYPVLLLHEWDGLTDRMRGLADRFAGWGYVCFDADLYGGGRTGESEQDNMRLMQPLFDDRDELLRRTRAAIAMLLEQSHTQGAQVVAVGYSFGGLAALDLLRADVPEVSGAISVHGMLEGRNAGHKAAEAKRALILHGWNDMLAPPERVLALATELTAFDCQWELQAFGNVFHAFTNPAADHIEAGLKYDADEDRHATVAIRRFIEEIFDPWAAGLDREQKGRTS